jgi:hypothetical protein
METEGSLLCSKESATSPILSRIYIYVYIQSSPSYSIYLRSILILSSHLRPSLPNGTPFTSSDKNFVCILFTPTLATCPAHLSLLALINNQMYGESFFFFFFFFYSCCSHLEDKASVKRFVSIQFLNLR